MLVVGELGWPLLDDGRPSNSLAQAQSLRRSDRQRAQLPRMARPAASRRSRRRPTRPTQLASLSQAAAGGRRAARDVRPDRGARRALRLSRSRGRAPGRRAAGGRRRRSRRSPGACTRSASGCPMRGSRICRLFPSPRDRHAGRAGEGAHRQDRPVRAADVETPADDADAVFDRRRRPRRQGDVATAERLYRRVMKIDPGDPAAPFNLGNLLRAGGRNGRGRGGLSGRRQGRSRIRSTPGTISPTCSTTRAAPTRRSAASSARSTPIRRYADAHVQHRPAAAAARTACRGGGVVAALSHARRRLALGGARAARLKFCEIQLAGSIVVR